MIYICDNYRHLICLPHSISNLHKMALHLNINRCWFHENHYDIPKRRIDEIKSICYIVSQKELLKIVKAK